MLSDTKGVDIHPYLTAAMGRIRVFWYQRIPASARAPVMKKGYVAIDAHLMKDGSISDLRYFKRSGDSVLDQAAYDAIAQSSPLPPLPDEFACQYVAVRLQFSYNPGPLDFPTNSHGKDFPLIPCVTSVIRLGGEIRISLSPSSAQVVSGGKQQFSATVTGTRDSGLNWSVEGPGCAGATCGVVSADGLYTAPVRIPNPATITITVSLANAPSETASATATIVQPTSSH